MKKITIIALHLGFGGIERYISNLAHMLEKEYHLDIICVYKFNDKSDFYFSDKIKIKYLVDGKPREKSLKKYLFSFKVFSFFKEIFRRFNLLSSSNRLLKKELKELSTDIVITTREKHNNMVGKHVNKSILKIATEHNHHQDNAKYINKLKKSISGFDYFVLPTKELYNYYKNITEIKCIYIQNHLKDIPKEKTSFKNKNIISVGRFSSEKGFLDLIDVFSLINKVDNSIKLYLLGDGYQKDAITEKIKELGLSNNVITPGFVFYQGKYYKDSSLYVMTSFSEAFGLVLIEAMSYGLPCVAFDSASGPRELINKDIGILIKDRNKEKMAEEIINLLNDNQKLIEYQKNINKIILNYCENAAKEKWTKILNIN